MCVGFIQDPGYESVGGPRGAALRKLLSPGRGAAPRGAVGDHWLRNRNEILTGVHGDGVTLRFPGWNETVDPRGARPNRGR